MRNNPFIELQIGGLPEASRTFASCFLLESCADEAETESAALGSMGAYRRSQRFFFSTARTAGLLGECKSYALTSWL